MSLEHIILVAVAFVLGGILKGATGVGAPFLAVPIMAILVNVPFAVAVFLVPNILINAWQAWRFRADNPAPRFAYTFALAGAVGAAFGTWALSWVDGLVLTTTVALVVLAYVVFRLVNPNWSLSQAAADRSVGPVGGFGGFFQGAIGLSGPISVSYMTAVGLPRPRFIFTMSLYFLAMTLVQFPLQLAFGIMTLERFVYGLLAIAPLAVGMYAGDLIGRRMSRATFDRMIFVILTLLALRLLAEAFVQH